LGSKSAGSDRGIAIKKLKREGQGRDERPARMRLKIKASLKKSARFRHFAAKKISTGCRRREFRGEKKDSFFAHRPPNPSRSESRKPGV